MKMHPALAMMSAGALDEFRRTEVKDMMLLNSQVSRRRGLASEKGSSAYTYLGVAIVVAVFIGLVVFFPWSQVIKKAEDKSFQEASVALAEGKWELAVTLLDKSLEQNPNNVAAYVCRSRASLQLGNLEQSLEDAEKALKLEAANAQALGQRGIVHKLFKRNEQSIADFSKAVKIDPTYWWAYGQLADVLLREKALEQALKNADKCLELNPDFVEGLRLRGRILGHLGKCKEAFEDFGRAEKLRPDDAMALQDKAWFLMTCPDENLQDPGQAMELAKKAYDLTGGKDALVQETLAEALFRQGDAMSAVQHQKKAIELAAPKCPDGSCLEGMRERLKKYELAARKETRKDYYEILPLDDGRFKK